MNYTSNEQEEMMEEKKENLVRDVLLAVQDSIASGVVPDDESMALLNKSYGCALNESPCPCGSCAKYAECCKREYQAVVRGVKGVICECVDGVEAKEQIEGEAVGAVPKTAHDIKWCCRVGIGARGEPVVDTTGMDMDRPEISPQQIAGVLIVAYHDLMVNGAFMLANGVYNRVMHDLGAARIGGRLPDRLVACKSKR